jgi:hypothetical protein
MITSDIFYFIAYFLININTNNYFIFYLQMRVDTREVVTQLNIMIVLLTTIYLEHHLISAHVISSIFFLLNALIQIY